jgi:hypothetical protein
MVGVLTEVLEMEHRVVEHLISASVERPLEIVLLLPEVVVDAVGRMPQEEPVED